MVAFTWFPFHCVFPDKRDHENGEGEEEKKFYGVCAFFYGEIVAKIISHREYLRKMVEQSIGIVTALNPYIGYTNATQVAQEALASGKSVYDLVLEKKLLSKGQRSRFADDR